MESSAEEVGSQRVGGEVPTSMSPLHRTRPAPAGTSSRACKRRITEVLGVGAVFAPGGADPPRVDFLALLPEPVSLHILLRLPPPQVASSCALVSTSWASLCRRPHLWKELCLPWALTCQHASSVLGGWRGLFALAFGSNLVQSPCFESIPTTSSASPYVHASSYRAHRPFLQPLSPARNPSEAGEGMTPGLMEVWAVEHMDSIPCAASVAETEYRTLTHWAYDRDHRLPPGRVPSLWEGTTCFRTTVGGSSLANAGGQENPPPVDAVPRVEPGSVGVTPPRCVDVAAGLLQCTPAEECVAGWETGAACARLDLPPGDPPLLQHSLLGLYSAEEEGRALPPSPIPLDDGGCAPSRLPPLVGSPLTPGAPPSGLRPVEGCAALELSGDSWGCVKQCISLEAFPREFLDACPPLRLSAWCCVRAAAAAGAEGDGEGREEAEGPAFRMEVVMAGEAAVPIFQWDSMLETSPGWCEVSGFISGYPSGLRGIIVKVAGRGAICTKLKLHFTTEAEE